MSGLLVAPAPGELPEPGADATPPGPEAGHSSGWPEPDLSLLRRGRRQPPPLPLDVFGPWADWIKDAAAGAGAPVDYVVCPLLVAISTMIGKVRAAPSEAGWIAKYSPMESGSPLS